MKRNIIVVTGGAGFIGSNLIKYFLDNSNLNLISIDNYSTGSAKNHIKDKRVLYLKGETKDINNILKKKKHKINSIFHFGEFSRIYQSFLKTEECLLSNSVGSNSVFSFCLKYKIKLIYSATSAAIGNKGKNKNLSPYAFTKSKNIEFLENLKLWFNLKYEIVYFYNVYGPGQICKGDMATIIGIFEELYKNKKPLTVVKPGSQTRRFTHVSDTVKACFDAWKKNKCRHYSITNKKSYSIIEVAKLFKTKIKFLPPRKGERFASALTNMNLSNKVNRIYGSIKLSDYISNFIKNYQ